MQNLKMLVQGLSGDLLMPRWQHHELLLTHYLDLGPSNDECLAMPLCVCVCVSVYVCIYI